MSHRFSGHRKLRTIILDDTASSFVEEQEKQHHRFEDQWNGIEWLLSRKPEQGTPMDKDYPCWCLLKVIPRKKLVDGLRGITLLYSFNNESVTIHSICFNDQH